MHKLYPTPWQKKILWSTLTALAIAVLALLAALLVVGASRALGFLQPLLIPVAVAGILAFLLHPLVSYFVRRLKMRRLPAVLLVLALVFVPVAWTTLWLGGEISRQSADFALKVPGYIKTALLPKVTEAIHWLQVQDLEGPYIAPAVAWMQEQAPLLPQKIWGFVSGSVHGVLGMVGLVVGFLFVPFYLYYFLINAEAISRSWGEYLPLRASPLRDEVVDCLNEINSYLIAFFRGQVLVSGIDGILIAAGLLAMGMNFALLIGLMAVVLQLIPYLGAVLCWLPAVVIAYAQWQDWWHPLLVTLLFVAVSQLESFVLGPRIVGKAVGLHPMTVMVSMAAWILLVGGLLGALLAVPLTATLKVLLRRYVWVKRWGGPSQEPQEERMVP